MLMQSHEMQSKGDLSISKEELVTLQIFHRFLKKGRMKKADNVLYDVSELSSMFFRWVLNRLRKVRVYHKLHLFEKSFFNLCVLCKPRLQSVYFLKAVGRILSKVESYLKDFTEMMVEEGKPIAERIGAILLSWGNKDGVKLSNDRSFMCYLGVNKHSLDGSWRP